MGRKTGFNGHSQVITRLSGDYIHNYAIKKPLCVFFAVKCVLYFKVRIFLDFSVRIVALFFLGIGFCKRES